MSIMWTPEDDNAIEALQVLKDNNHCLMVCQDGSYVMRFNVVDELKANNFLMTILRPNKDQDDKSDVTGIKVQEIGHDVKYDVDEAKALIQAAYSKLSDEKSTTSFTAGGF